MDIKKENVLMLGYDFKRTPLLAIETDWNWRKYLKDATKDMVEDLERPAVCLSGGIDSAIIAYYAKKYNPKTVAFTMNLDDEIPVKESKEIAKKLNMKHIIKKKSLLRRDVDKALEEIFEFFYPFDKGSLIPNYILFQLLEKEKFDGVFFGDGADELFGGYKRHFQHNISFADNIRIFGIHELKLWGLEPSQEVLKMRKRYEKAESVVDRLKLEWEYEFPNAHLLKMEKYSEHFDINSLFPYLVPEVRYSALAAKPKIDFNRKIRKLQLHHLYTRLIGIEREKIPLKFDYLRYVCPRSIKDKKIRKYLKGLDPTSRNYNRKIWISYILEKYEEVKS